MLPRTCPLGPGSSVVAIDGLAISVFFPTGAEFFPCLRQVLGFSVPVVKDCQTALSLVFL